MGEGRPRVDGWRFGWSALGVLCVPLVAGGCSASDAPPSDTAPDVGPGGGGGASLRDASSERAPEPRADSAAAGEATPAFPDAGQGPKDETMEAGPALGDSSPPRPEAGPGAAGVFVAVGYGGRTSRSVDDGRTWIDDTSLSPKGGDDDNLLRTVLWGNGKFVALGWRVLTSPDGHLWTPQGPVMAQWIGATVYAKGAYVAVGGYGLRSTSVDAIAWRPHTIDTVASHAHGGLVYGDAMGGRFVSTNDDGARSYATDGTDWKFSTGAANVLTSALAYGKGVFVGIGETQVVMSSDGGASWSLGPKLAAAAEALVFAEGRFTAVGTGHVFTSADGASWDDHPVKDIAPGALAYGHGTYVMVLDTTFRRSKDALVWEAPVVAGGANPYEWLAFGAP